MLTWGFSWSLAFECLHVLSPIGTPAFTLQGSKPNYFGHSHLRIRQSTGRYVFSVSSLNISGCGDYCEQPVEHTREREHCLYIASAFNIAVMCVMDAPLTAAGCFLTKATGQKPKQEADLTVVQRPPDHLRP